MNMRLNEFKPETVSSIHINRSSLSSNIFSSSYDQPSADLINCTLLKSPEKYSHASKFTKHLSFMTLEGDTVLQIQKWQDAIISTFFQYLSTNRIWPEYKYLKEEHHDISSFIIQPDTYPKFTTAKKL